MPDFDTQATLDFGDPELNDPNYEQNVDAPQEDSNDPTPQVDAGEQQADVQQEQPVADPAQPQGGEGDPSNQAAPQEQQEQRPADRLRTRSDKDGNLVDGAGNIVAKAGVERRQFERTQAQATHITRLERENEELRRTDSMAQALNEVPQKLGLDMRETEMGLQAIASFKKDPVATARWMLQETMRMGYNLNQIVGEDAQGQVNGGSLDLAAVKAMISEQVAPLVQDRTAQQQQHNANAGAQREYDAFMAKHDYASVHEDTLTRMLQQSPSTTPEVAYWQLREFAAKHGFDFSKPLRAQADARQRGDPQPNGNANPQTQTRPMPNGGAPTADMQQGPTMAHPDDQWDSIVQQSLAEAGFTH